MRVEPGQSAIGCEPVRAIPHFDHVVHDSMGQSLIDSVVGELISVEPRKSLQGAEPQISGRVLNDTAYVIAGQPIRRGVDSHGQLLGACQTSHQQGSPKYFAKEDAIETRHATTPVLSGQRRAFPPPVPFSRSLYAADILAGIVATRR